MGPLHFHAACRHWSSLIARRIPLIARAVANMLLLVLVIVLFGGQGVEDSPEDFHNNLM